MRIISGFDVHKLAVEIVSWRRENSLKRFIGTFWCRYYAHAIWCASAGSYAWAISASIFPITTHSIRAQTAENYYPTFWVDFGRRIMHNKYRCDNYCTKAQNDATYRTNANIYKKPSRLIWNQLTSKQQPRKASVYRCRLGHRSQ